MANNTLQPEQKSGQSTLTVDTNGFLRVETAQGQVKAPFKFDPVAQVIEFKSKTDGHQLVRVAISALSSIA